MQSARTPTSSWFVVRSVAGVPLDLRELRRRLIALAWVEEIEGHATLALVHPERPASDPRETWQELQQPLGSAYAVAPALRGPADELAYPTGRIEVRFIEKWSDEQLEEFAKIHGLAWIGRNDFVAVQSGFSPLKPEQVYLPDIVHALQGAAGVKAAWPETLARYRRQEAAPRAAARA